MKHLTKSSQVCDINSIIPEQKIYGSLEYQEEFSKSNNFEGKPNLYLTAMINDIFNSVISSLYSNNFENIKINILSGLDIGYGEIQVSENYDISPDEIFITIAVNINPGELIFNGVHINITKKFKLKIDVSYTDLIIKKLYDHIVITTEFVLVETKSDESPLRFKIFLYNPSTNSLYTDLPLKQINWNSKIFIYKTLHMSPVIANDISNMSYTQCNHKKILIGSLVNRYNEFQQLQLKEYFTNLNNYYKWLYFKMLDEYFYSNYFIDIPYVPPIPKSSIFGISGIFL